MILLEAGNTALTPRTGPPLKNDGGSRRTFNMFKGVLKLCELVPLRVLRPKMTPAGVVSVTLRGL